MEIFIKSRYNKPKMSPQMKRSSRKLPLNMIISDVVKRKNVEANSENQFITKRSKFITQTTDLSQEELFNLNYGNVFKKVKLEKHTDTGYTSENSEQQSDNKEWIPKFIEKDNSESSYNRSPSYKWSPNLPTIEESNSQFFKSEDFCSSPRANNELNDINHNRNTYNPFIQPFLKVWTPPNDMSDLKKFSNMQIGTSLFHDENYYGPIEEHQQNFDKYIQESFGNSPQEKLFNFNSPENKTETYHSNSLSFNTPKSDSSSTYSSLNDSIKKYWPRDLCNFDDISSKSEFCFKYTNSLESNVLVNSHIIKTTYEIDINVPQYKN